MAAGAPGGLLRGISTDLLSVAIKAAKEGTELDSRDFPELDISSGALAPASQGPSLGTEGLDVDVGGGGNEYSDEEGAEEEQEEGEWDEEEDEEEEVEGGALTPSRASSGRAVQRQ